MASAHRVLYPEHHLLPIPHPEPSVEAHRLIAEDGRAFTVWRLRPHSPRARVLLCHGYYASRYQVLDIAQGLRQRGYEVLVLELRGHGDRPGPCTLGMKESADGIQVLTWAKAQSGVAEIPVGVVGLSMGAAVVCQIAARCQMVRAVVVDSVYSRLFPVLCRSMWIRYCVPAVPWGWVTWCSLHLALRRRLSRIDPVVLAERLTVPLLAIQGGEDRRVVPLLGREFYQRWAGPKERWFEPQVAHVGMFAKHPVEYCDRISAFFDRVLVV